MGTTASDIPTFEMDWSAPTAPPESTWIWWSENDRAYLCAIPCKWHAGGYVVGHGDTEIAALIMAKDAHIALLESVAYDYDELINRDKAGLDIFWLKDESLESSENLPDPDVIAQEIVEDLEAALEQFREIATDLGAVEAPEQS